MRLNTANKFTEQTHEGAPAAHQTALQSLRRSVSACLLWEDTFYESGVEIAERIFGLAKTVEPEAVAALAIEARTQLNLRHAPLLLLSALAQTGAGVPHLVANTIEKVIQRADELAEFLVVHAATNGVTPDQLKPKLSAQMKKGLAKAFRQFDEYQLAKYDRAGKVRLRDVLFLVHPKAENDAQQDLWRRLVENKLEIPDTWETNLSAGKGKKETFERLIREDKLGYMALVRNLRNMAEAGVDEKLINDAILAGKGAHRLFPYRFFTAAKAAPRFEKALDQALLKRIEELPELSGQTLVLIDTSGSMQASLSAGRGYGRPNAFTPQRVDAASIIASLVKGDVRVFIFGNTAMEMPHRLGMAGADQVRNAIGRVGHGTEIGQSVAEAERIYPNADRIIVFSDEQSWDRLADPRAKRAYMVNVAPYKNGVGYGRWNHIDGWSEGFLRWIREFENSG